MAVSSRKIENATSNHCCHH